MADRPPHIQAEMDGMRAVPDTGAEPWVTRLKPPHPVHVARAAGALITVTESLTQAYMVAYTLDDAGLLAGPAPATLDLAALALASRAYVEAWDDRIADATILGSLAQRIAVLTAPAEAAAQKAWETFKVAYSDYQKKNPNWQAFWTDHHAFAFDAALAALREGQ